MNLEEIKAREQATTPGPWVAGDGSRKCGFNGESVIVALKDGQPYAVMERSVYPNSHGFNEQVFADMRFAAHARADIPALIAEVERLTAENKKLHEISAQNYGDRYLEMQEENATLKKALSDMLFAYQNKDGDCPHQFEIEAAHQAQQLTHDTHGVEK